MSSPWVNPPSTSAPVVPASAGISVAALQQLEKEKRKPPEDPPEVDSDPQWHYIALLIHAACLDIL